MGQLSHVLVPSGDNLSLVNSASHYGVLYHYLGLIRDLSNGEGLYKPSLTYVVLCPSQFQGVLSGLLLHRATSPSAFVGGGATIANHSKVRHRGVFYRVGVLRCVS